MTPNPPPDKDVDLIRIVLEKYVGDDFETAKQALSRLTTRTDTLQRENEEMRTLCHEAYEIYAGMEGGVAETAYEGYLLQELEKMAHIIGEAKRATGRLNAAPEWRPISEAPRDGEIIIMYGKSRHAAFDTVGTGHWYRPGKRFVWDNYLGDEPRPPTHWQPLPEPPAGADKGDK